jgi:hypothetical protein
VRVDVDMAVDKSLSFSITLNHPILKMLKTYKNEFFPNDRPVEV